MTRTPREIDSEVRRIRHRLHAQVEDSDVPRHQVDRQLGHSNGYLSQLLAGTIDLKYRHVIAVLDAIGCPPPRFFQDAFPRRQKNPRRNPRLEAMLKTDPDVVGVYSLGIEAVQELRQRVERCEQALQTALARRSSCGAGTPG